MISKSELVIRPVTIEDLPLQVSVANARERYVDNEQIIAIASQENICSWFV